MKELEAEV